MLLLDLHDVSTEEQDVGEGGRAGKLSAEEEGVLERARDESARITREELPRMFETGSARKALLCPLLPAFAPEDAAVAGAQADGGGVDHDRAGGRGGRRDRVRAVEGSRRTADADARIPGPSVSGDACGLADGTGTERSAASHYAAGGDPGSDMAGVRRAA